MLKRPRKSPVLVPDLVSSTRTCGVTTIAFWKMRPSGNCSWDSRAVDQAYTPAGVGLFHHRNITLGLPHSNNPFHLLTSVSSPFDGCGTDASANETYRSSVRASDWDDCESASQLATTSFEEVRRGEYICTSRRISHPLPAVCSPRTRVQRHQPWTTPGFGAFLSTVDGVTNHHLTHTAPWGKWYTRTTPQTATITL